MSETIHSNQFSDEEENPTGGYSHGVGFAIIWQDGPVDPENGPNGATVEAVLTAVIDRLKFLGIDHAQVAHAVESVINANPEDIA